MSGYASFLNGKRQLGNKHGFEPVWMPNEAFDFQKHLASWTIRQGRSAEFADTGLGKSLMELVWAENVVRHTNKPVLLLTPLAVGPQMLREAAKFCIDAERSMDGKVKPGARVIIANNERVHHFNANDFAGVAIDESGCLKNFDGRRKQELTEFMRMRPYRLLASATPSPNDYIELGSSSEALGELGYIDMLKMFFKSNDNTFAQGGGGNGMQKRFAKDPFGGKFRFRGHSEMDFWRWVCSWARAVRKPSDLGAFDDSRYILPPLDMAEHMTETVSAAPGFLFAMPANGLKEQREEVRRTLKERCEKVASLVSGTGAPVVCWCNLNDEGDLLEELLQGVSGGVVQVSGADSDEVKEEKLGAFTDGQTRILVTKGKIAGWGLNWQHCAHHTFFPSHSFEMFYQCIRRSYRFGQKKRVKVDIITSEGERGILDNLKRKADAAGEMFSRLVEQMNNQLNIEKQEQFNSKMEVPSWL